MRVELPQPVGVAFSGGLARATAQIGMQAVLEQRAALSFDLVAGTSTGAINAALFAQDPREWRTKAERFWRGVAQDKALSSVWRSTMRSLTNSAAGRTQTMVVKHLERAFGRTTFAQLDVPLNVVATDLGTGNAAVVSEGPVVEALLASCSFPVVTPPLQEAGATYVDGSFVAGVPIEPLLRAGARSLVLLDTGSSEVEASDVVDAAWYEVMALAATHMLRVQADHDITLAARKVPVLQVMSTAGSPFDLKAAPDLIECGEQAALDALRRLASHPGQRTLSLRRAGWYPTSDGD